MILLLLCVSSVANATRLDSWRLLSEIGASALVGSALALPIYKADWKGFKQAGFSVATASGVSLLGKSIIDSERPDKSGNDSFPSNHTASAFAAATTLNLRYGWEVGFPAYGLATLVGIGRVEADKHYWQDVLAGAVIGSIAGWAFTDSMDENVRLVPWAGRKAAGVMVTFNW